MNSKKLRAAFIKTRNFQEKNTRKSIIFLAITGLLFSVATIQLWLTQYHASTLSSLGFLGGLLLATTGFRYVQANIVPSHKVMQSDNFTDEEITTYFQEHEEFNKKALERWNQRGRYFVFIGGGLLILLLNLHATVEFASITLLSGISIFLINLVVFWVKQKH